MQITEKHIIGEVVVNDYRAASVFKQHGIDFCCNGNRPIEEACEKGQIDSKNLVAKLNSTISTLDSGNIDFQHWDADLLADYIEKKHHRFVKKQIPELAQFLNKIAKVHGEKHPELLEVEELFKASAHELLAHMEKEEQIIFPYVKGLMSQEKLPNQMFGSIQNPISVMMHEHNTEGERFRRIAELTNDYTPPADACTTYRVSFEQLKAFESDLHLHIHLENNILFPKVIALEQQIRMPKPLKRHPGLQPVSREHHLGLLLSWKIRTGITKGVDLKRISVYLNWFWATHLSPHFDFEEAHIFVILDADNELVTSALNQHKEIKHHISNLRKTAEDLEELAALLIDHIRFEERVLFPALEKHASEKQLNDILNAHQKISTDVYEDEFWV